MHSILTLHYHGGTPFTMTIIVLVGSLTMVTLNTQQTFAIANVGNAGQGRAGGGSSGGPYIDPSLFCDTGVTTPICTSSNTPSNLLHPQPPINHLSVTLRLTMNIPKQHSKITPNNADVAHVSSITPANLLHPRPLINHLPASNVLYPRPSINHLSVTLHPTGDSKGSSRHHYHNISAYTGSSTSSDSKGSSRHYYHNISAYTGSSTSSDSKGSSRHHYHNISHNIIIISHHHGKISGYAGSFGEGPGGSFGEGPGGSFGEGPGGSFGEGPGGSFGEGPGGSFGYYP